MSPDDIDSLTLKLHNFLVKEFNFPLDEEQDYLDLCDFLHDNLEQFVTKERNYN